MRDGGRYFPKDRKWFVPSRPHLLAIENPNSIEDDVTRNSFAMDGVSHRWSLNRNDSMCAQLGLQRADLLLAHPALTSLDFTRMRARIDQHVNKEHARMTHRVVLGELSRLQSRCFNARFFLFFFLTCCCDVNLRTPDQASL